MGTLESQYWSLICHRVNHVSISSSVKQYLNLPFKPSDDCDGCVGPFSANLCF